MDKELEKQLEDKMNTEITAIIDAETSGESLIHIAVYKTLRKMALDMGGKISVKISHVIQ